MNTASTYDVRVLGCKANQYDAQQIRRVLDLSGLQATSKDRAADVVVVHTCAVTATAIRKSRHTIRRAVEESPNARVIVTGCGAEKGLLEGLPGHDTDIPPREGWLGQLSQSLNDLNIPHSSPSLPERPDDLPIESFTGHTRAFLKVQDGCDIGCTFCIVPRLRRKPRDKPLEHIVREAKALVWNGHKEIVVSGISVGLYGQDSEHSLPTVLEALIAIPELERIRLSSLHPRELTEDLLNVWASSEKMLPHVHLPLQAGSDRVLERMKRSYTQKEFLEAVDRARNMLDRPAFNNDVIVGFPGETEEDFGETIKVCREVGFSRMHIFPYSPRPGTRAERYAERVDSKKVKERCRQLRLLADDLSYTFHRQFLGEQAAALAEGWDPSVGQYEGYTERYIPVRFHASAGLKGCVVPISIRSVATGYVRGECASSVDFRRQLVK